MALMATDPAQFIAEEVRAFREGVRDLRVAPTVTSDVLRACITHDDTSFADIDVLCEELDQSLRS